MRMTRTSTQTLTMKRPSATANVWLGAMRLAATMVFVQTAVAFQPVVPVIRQQHWATTTGTLSTPLLSRPSRNNSNRNTNTDSNTRLSMTSETDPVDPQVWSCGYSPKQDLLAALQEATELAIEGLPTSVIDIDLAMISVSSLYDGQSNPVSPSLVVPTVLTAAQGKSKNVRQLVGNSVGGIVSSLRNIPMTDDTDESTVRACNPIETEGIPGVSVTLALLPDVAVKVRVC